MGQGPEWDAEVAQRMSESGKGKRSELGFGSTISFPVSSVQLSSVVQLCPTL